MRISGTLRGWAPPALLICLVLGLACWAEAQSTRGYELKWSSVDGGAGTSKSSDGRFEVSGTVGQPDAGVLRSTDRHYSLLGGFWGVGQLLRVPALVQVAALSLMLFLALLSWRRLSDGPKTRRSTRVFAKLGAFLMAQVLAGSVSAAPLGSEFTYQGRLLDNGAPATGLYDLRFELYAEAAGGSALTAADIQEDVPVADGAFTAHVDFGYVFGDSTYYLQLAIRPGSSTGSFTLLDPRQPLTATPSALFSRTAGNAEKLDGMDASSFAAANHSHPASDIASGTIALQRIPQGVGSGLSADTLDGLDSAVFQRKVANVVVVAKSGGQFATIQAAMDSIVDATANKHYLVWVAPGSYTEAVTMKQYVDIEGAGELATSITAGGDTATVTGAGNAELRFVTVIHAGGVAATAIANVSSNFRLTHVTASASGATGGNAAVSNSGSSAVVMSALTASASGGLNATAVHNANSSPKMTDVSAIASGASDSNIGVQNDSASPEMMNVIASGVGDGQPIADSRGINNSNSSARMTNVTATASGGNQTYGVINFGPASPTMTNVMASGSGATLINVGVSNSDSSPTMTNVTAIGAGGANAYGVYNAPGSPTIDNCVISASGATSSNGIQNFAPSGTYSVRINNTQIRVTGTTKNTISNDTEYSTFVGASLMEGGPVTGGGTVKCAGVYDEDYAFYASTCPP